MGRQVCHPHLVPVLSAHVSQQPYYLVMPWLEGATLAQRLATGAATPLPVALWLARQVAEALDALDQAGWTHADVKPANILISPQGHATLLDLGFARRVGEEHELPVESIAGTIGYLAPETLISTLRPDIRSDIFSLGATLYEVLSGQRPFAARSLEQLVDEHRREQPRELRSLNPRLPPAVCQLVRQMLAKEPLRRPQTPRELAQRLTALEIETFSERIA